MWGVSVVVVDSSVGINVFDIVVRGVVIANVVIDVVVVVRVMVVDVVGTCPCAAFGIADVVVVVIVDVSAVKYGPSSFRRLHWSRSSEGGGEQSLSTVACEDVFDRSIRALEVTAKELAHDEQPHLVGQDDVWRQP